MTDKKNKGRQTKEKYIDHEDTLAAARRIAEELRKKQAGKKTTKK